MEKSNRLKDIERIIWKNQTRWINKTNIINVKKNRKNKMDQ